MVSAQWQRAIFWLAKLLVLTAPLSLLWSLTISWRFGKRLFLLRHQQKIRVLFTVLAKMCASRDSVEDPLVAWSFEELDCFYATHIYALRKLVAASTPQIVLLATPLLIGTVFYCSVLPNVLCVVCDCCGELLQTFMAVDSSKFVFRNDGMVHFSLPEPLPVVDERLKTLGNVSIQMCGNKRICNRTECVCNRKAVLCHSETIRTNITSKTVDWINRKCIW